MPDPGSRFSSAGPAFPAGALVRMRRAAGLRTPVFATLPRGKNLECGDLSPLLPLWRLVAKAGPRPARPGGFGRLPAFDGDKSPAESADKSAHSRVVAARPHWVHPCPSVVTWASPSRGGEGAGAPCAFVSDTRFRLLPPLGGEGRDEGVARHTERPRLQDAARPLTPTLSPEGERERLTLFRRKEVRAS